MPERGYQLAMIKTSLLHNTLVALPTGLGKTLIAAVVMYNFSRWFPQVRAADHEPLTFAIVVALVQICTNKFG